MSNIVNIDRYNPHKYKFFGIFNNFKGLKGSWKQKAWAATFYKIKKSFVTFTTGLTRRILGSCQDSQGQI